MEFVAGCAEGSCLQSKRIVEIRRLGRRFGADIVQLLIILGISEMNLVRGDADNWAYLGIKYRVQVDQRSFTYRIADATFQLGDKTDFSR